MMKVRMYYVDGDSNAEGARRELASLQDSFPHRLAAVEVSGEPSLRSRFGAGLPAVEIGPYTLRWPFSLTDLRVTLSSAQQSPLAQARNAAGTEAGVRRARRAQRGVLAVARHWLAGANLFVLALVGLPFLAPVLMQAGVTTPAGWIYTIYSPMCHQLGFRSWFLFGGQPAYPRSIVAGDETSFEDATGIPDSDFAAARDFRGNPGVGYKVAFCQRDVAIYAGVLTGGLVYALSRRRLPALPLWAWLVFGIAPIALDGGTQLLSGWGWFPGPLRESTPALRTLTGIAFGFLNVWYAYPLVEETMAETRALLRAQLHPAAG
ncbi:MAG: DUF2085 domain-containing protein [Anaerolineales bacterium]